MKQKRNFRRIQWFLGLLLLGSLAFVHFYAPRFITEIHNPLIEFARSKTLADTVPSFPSNPSVGKYLKFQSFDGTALEAYVTFSKLDSAKGTIVLLHGIRSKKEHFLRLSDTLAKLGFHAVALDLRAHGESEGIHCTFGVKEKQDVAALISQLIEQEHLHPNIGIWGQSLGGAIALQAMGSDPRICFGVVESTFSDFRTVTHDYFDFFLGFDFSFLTNYLVDRAGTIAGFDPDEARPVDFCERITQPILMVHGGLDQRIDIRYGKENFEHLASNNKTFLEIPDASHLNVWQTKEVAYFSEVFAFLDTQVSTANDTKL